MPTFDPDSLDIAGGHFIDGRRIDGSGIPATVLRPSDAHPYQEIRGATPQEVDEAVESAARAFRTSGWASIAPRERNRVMRRWACLIEEEAGMLARLESTGSTRPISETIAWDIPYSAETIRFFAECADKVGGEVAATASDKLGFVAGEPIGVIGAVAPWNFPLVMACWKIAPAIAAGNAVVLKPSELTPFSIVRLAELAIIAGMPAGIFNIVQGNGQLTGDALCRHPKIGKVTFTGSTQTGAKIMTACAQSGTKPVTLELGGKSPQIVFADAANLDRVSAAIARAITGNAGQVCVAGSRLIVEAPIAEELVHKIAGHFSKLCSGPTWHGGTTLPPIISRAQCERIDGIVQRTIASGAQAVTGGGRAASPQEGAYYQPTILSNVDHTSEAVREEIFGPVLTVQTFRGEEEALRMANDSPYGLAAGVHTGDVAKALRATRALEVGTVWVNRYGRSNDYNLPTGGYKRSGIGKDLGRQAYEANLRYKTTLIEFQRDG